MEDREGDTIKTWLRKVTFGAGRLMGKAAYCGLVLGVLNLRVLLQQLYLDIILFTNLSQSRITILFEGLNIISISY